MKLTIFLLLGLFLVGCGNNSSSDPAAAAKSNPPPAPNTMTKSIKDNPKIPDAAKRALLGNGAVPGK